MQKTAREKIKKKSVAKGSACFIFSRAVSCAVPLLTVRLEEATSQSKSISFGRIKIIDLGTYLLSLRLSSALSGIFL